MERTTRGQIPRQAGSRTVRSLMRSIAAMNAGVKSNLGVMLDAVARRASMTVTIPRSEGIRFVFCEAEICSHLTSEHARCHCTGSWSAESKRIGKLGDRYWDMEMFVESIGRRCRLLPHSQMYFELNRPLRGKFALVGELPISCNIKH